jgi:hypothetical protein
MSPSLYVSIFPDFCKRKTELTENGTNGKRQLQFVCCKQKMEMANFYLYATNRVGKGIAVTANVPIYVRMENQESKSLFNC